MTTGRERLEQVRKVRRDADRVPLGVDISDYSDEFCEGFIAGQGSALDFILPFLDDCVVLDPGEVAFLRATLLEFFGDAKARGRGGDGIYGRREKALALLGADDEPQDVGPPAPGEGEDLANPEQGMEC